MKSYNLRFESNFPSKFLTKPQNCWPPKDVLERDKSGTAHNAKRPNPQVASSSIPFFSLSPEPKIECVSWSIETGADKGRRVYNGTLLSFVHVAVDMDRVRTREDSSVGRKGSGRPIRNCRDVKIRT